MEFISAEEFLKQPKEVQGIFFKWANDNAEDYDLVQDNGEIMLYKDFIERARIEFDSYPLFTEGQLRRFIEDKTEGVISELSLYKKGYQIIIGHKDEYIDSEPRTKKIFRNLNDNLLQVYWKVACEIAKESVKND
ncbi:hypothetical protein [uncultured Clostridium sp.]|uniref:hypothetical protein n=1 Tax=uncultured Clostridium sp. TaxID=59620 RepID=UPI003216FC02